MIKYVQTLAILFVSCITSVVHSETIEQVLERSTRERVGRMQSVDLSTVPDTIAAFTKIRNDTTDVQTMVMLKVVQGPDAEVAMTDGRSIIVHAIVEHLAPIERDFMIAHEIGHIANNHLRQRIALYQKYYPGEVTPEAVAAVNRSPGFGREMMQFSHQCEYEADAYALKRLMSQGWTRDQVINAVLGFARTQSTATHPSSFRRVANLRNVSVPEVSK